MCNTCGALHLMCFFLFSYFKQSGPKGKVSLLFQMSMAMNIKKIN